MVSSDDTYLQYHLPSKKPFPRKRLNSWKYLTEKQLRDFIVLHKLKKIKIAKYEKQTNQQTA